MVISALTGGLGNQLFQYAVGFALARRQRSRFALDLRHYDLATPAGLPPRPFELGRLKISAEPMAGLDRLRVLAAEPWPSSRLAVRAASSLSVRSGWTRVRQVVDTARGYDPRLASPPSGLIRLSGCWQAEGFFVEQRSALVEEFTFRLPPDRLNAEVLSRIAAVEHPVCVHVRRGDYTRPETLTQPLGLDYYGRALAWITGRVPGARHFVFSDDPAWARANLPLPDSATFVSHNVGVNDPEDLRLMQACRHFVIANSSFSWWAAWLGAAADKRVVAPARWYAQPHGSEADLVPTEWTRL